jgi:hypothetical protein
MPEAAKGPRLWLRRERRDQSGTLTHPAVWYIRDEGTGCGIDDRERAVQLLADYIAQKRLDGPPRSARDPASVPVADVIARYVRDVAAKRARPKEAAQRARALLAYFGNKTLADINGDCCRRYAEQRSTDAAARRELEDLRAAINHHRREGLCSQVVEVVLPPERAARERWLTRSEAARLILAAWRYREIQKGRPTDRRSRQHVAKFMLVALYTGTRASAVCGAALEPTPGCGWIDVERGVFYRRPARRLETKKTSAPGSVAAWPVGASAALETAWADLRRRMEPRAGHGRQEGIRQRRGRCGAGSGRDAARAAAYGGHVVDAGRSRHVGGRRLSRDDGRDVVAALRASSSGPPGAGEKFVLRREPPHLPPHLARNQTRTDVIEREKNRNSFKDGQVAPLVRDEGVAG